MKTDIVNGIVSFIQYTLCNTITIKRPHIVFQDQLSLIAGQKYCSMLQVAILSTFIEQSFVIKIFILSFFEWPFYIGFTVHICVNVYIKKCLKIPM